MAEDWAIDVRKYAPDADDAIIQGIVRYCSIALQSKDASLVAFADPAELDRVRENYCRKQLGLTQSDAELDLAIARVGERMGGDTTRNRVTVYYLLAEAFGKLGLFGTAAAAAPAYAVSEPPPVAMAAAPEAAPHAASPRIAPAAVMAPAAAMGGAAVATSTTQMFAPARGRAREQEDDGIFSTGIIALGVMAGAILVAAVAGPMIARSLDPTLDVGPQPIVAGEIPSTLPPGPAVTAAIPEGSGVVAQDIEGKPQLSVYFDTASTEVTPDFAAAAAPIKAYVDAYPGSRLAVSGYNDPRGDAAFNAELSKNRAKSVAAALAALGIPVRAIVLVKPAETTDDTTSLENARRVDVVVTDGG